MAEADPMRPVTGPLRTMDLVRDRAVEAVLGRAGLHHPALAEEIRRRFGSADVAAGALVREPVIEGAAPFVSSGRTFADCAGTLLHRDVVRAISSDRAGDYRFRPDAQPYKHQIEAWEHLTAPERRSVLVSSGTGSGKTECFLMPLLHDLASEAEKKGRLTGVRALALYPLNALIASQQERLRAWTQPFGDKIRFGLYNGLTPERLRALQKPGIEQAADRETLRSDPPPILVTNVTMLEYLTVRRVDRPLIENSRGQLRWIILDEAHGYVGSAAAEIALLIRRVLLAFGVRAEDVRFVATSATIGDGRDVTNELRRFLRDIAGADEDRVRVVLGEREKVELPPPSAVTQLTDVTLADRDAMKANPAVQSFVQAAQDGPITLARAEGLLATTGQPTEVVLQAIADDADRQRDPLLPLRLHGFLRAVPGLWSCLNPACVDSPEGWPYGSIHTERIDDCPSCRAPVLEVMTCRECGEPWLDCEERDGHLRPRYTPPTIDEFAALREREIASDDETDESSEDALYDADRLMLAVRPLDGCHLAHVDSLTGKRHDAVAPGLQILHTHSASGCAACDAKEGNGGDVMRPFRFGAPFLIGNAAPVFLEGVPRTAPEERPPFPLPAEGRQLLSFTDSRQGTARFAASLQTNAERGFVRSYLYHAVQGSMAPPAEEGAQAEALRAEIAALEAVPSELRPPALDALLSTKKNALAERGQPSLNGIPWSRIREDLAGTAEVKKWMTEVWKYRDDRYRASPEDFAQFLLLREFARRPRRANTAETLGLARLRFAQIDAVTRVPNVLAEKGKSLASWKGLLYSIVDMTVRANMALHVKDDDLHWVTRQGWRKTMLPFGEPKQAKSEISWPKASKAGVSNLVLILEKALGLDRAQGHDRTMLNDVLEAAWRGLMPLLHDPARSTYALDFDRAHLAPVTQAWLCPVTGRILPETVLGFTPYGHREGLRPANHPAHPIVLPRLPVSFPRGSQVEMVRAWLDGDEAVAEVRRAGIWTNLQDRAALLSPYMRSAEHSAQQPPERLRRFEAEFKKGEINILNCSTTMEMGVDIGSVAAVMMTNVPPSLANYRQRVGRAGRRRQGFASSLTYTRDTPLDREAFRTPEAYLARQTRAPRVKLDSRRIVQRHVNALLLARWFASEGGEALKTRTGDFFGCPGVIGADRPEHVPVEACLAWLDAPGTFTQLNDEVAHLVRGTVLEGDATVFDAAHQALEAARDAVLLEWESLQEQAAGMAPAAQASLRYQLERMAGENLLGELTVRSVLPGHGMPTGVVPFVNADKPAPDGGDADRDDASRRRRSFPTRSLDIAIRDYAPGAEVVVDGLVYHSAGVTLNWRRPAEDANARDIQSMKVFWTCPSCGAADCDHVAPVRCPGCRAEIPFEARRRFLQPAGFTVDMRDPPHADTDDVRYVEPEPEQIVARGAAWEAMANPAQGRMRGSADGLVFYSSRGGKGHQGYHICLECGRAELAGTQQQPLKDHLPLRGTRRNEAGVCPGNDKAFKVTQAVALGSETVTDVAELQPAGLESEAAALAVVSALREALARRLGVEARELGMAVRRARGPLGQATHSLYLYDRASGGAGFAPQALALYEPLLQDARAILDCTQPGCVHGCSACVLTADLFAQQDSIDRIAALAWVEQFLREGSIVPPEDRAAPDARLCRSVPDAIRAAVENGARVVSIWLGERADVAGISEASFARFARRLVERGAKIDLIVSPAWLDALDPAARLALRDAVKVLGVAVRKGEAPKLANGARVVAAVEGDPGIAWATRDESAQAPGVRWGMGQDVPVVSITPPRLSPVLTVDLDSLLPPSGTRFLEIGNQFDGSLLDFGRRFAAMLAPVIREAGGTGTLIGMSYSDRYLQSPLVVRLMTDALSALRDGLGGRVQDMPLKIDTNRFKPNERQPYAPDHDWQWEEDRREILLALLEQHGFAADLEEGKAAHGRVITLAFVGGKSVRVILDQGFGPWRTPAFAKFNFGDDALTQARRIDGYQAMLAIRGPVYIVVTN